MTKGNGFRLQRRDVRLAETRIPTVLLYEPWPTATERNPGNELESGSVPASPVQ